jgi:colanic acid biosynthesis protein WcaH
MIIKKNLYKKIMESIPIVCIDVIIMNEKNEYLLVKRKNNPLKNKFWMVGGRLYKNEMLADGIKRKVNEEIGVKKCSIKYVGFFEEFFNKTEQNINSNFHAISFVYKALINSKTKIKIDNQSIEYKWFKKLPPLFKKIIPWYKKRGFN